MHAGCHCQGMRRLQTSQITVQGGIWLQFLHQWDAAQEVQEVRYNQFCLLCGWQPDTCITHIPPQPVISSFKRAKDCVKRQGLNHSATAAALLQRSCKEEYSGFGDIIMGCEVPTQDQLML